MAKVLCVLYDDPVDGHPRSYARDDIPRLEKYPDGQSMPSPDAVDFNPGELLGSVTGELGLRSFLEKGGHKFVVTSDKDRPGSVFERELTDTEIVISQPFWPAYLTRERIAKAPSSSSHSPPELVPITSICRLRSSAKSRWPRSLIATASASPSMW